MSNRPTIVNLLGGFIPLSSNLFFHGRDVVWCLPVGTGIFSLFPHPAGAAGALYPSAAQIRQVHVGEHLSDGHRGTYRCWNFDK